MSPRPPWLPPTRRAPISDSDLESLCRRLDSGESCWIQGSIGSGRTKVLSAVATRSDRRLVAVRLAGCREKSDIILALGWALRTVPCGSREAVIRAARELDHPLFLIDDADLTALDELITDLIEEIPDSSWLCAGSGDAPEILRSSSITLPPRPLPSLPKDLDLSATGPGTLHPALLLASLPAGLPHLGPLPTDLLLVDTPDRQVIRPAMLETLKSSVPAPSQVASELLRIYDRTLGLAMGAPILVSHRWEDALTLRWMGEVLADPDRACLASAAAARLLVAWGQPQSADRVLEGAHRRNARSHPRGLALLSWASAVCCLARGGLEGAEAHFDEAAAHLHDAGEDAILARLHQYRADEHIQRSNAHDGVQFLRKARRLLTVLADQASISSTLRCAADLAVANGELLSAETLYDQAAGSETPAQERIARRIGLASLAMSRGENRRAQRLIESQEQSHGSQIIHGNQQRRLADLAAREGRPEQAASHARHALLAYGRGGAHIAVGHIHRVLGDLAASSGAIADAWRHYMSALHVHLQLQDYRGLVRTVERVSLLEEMSGQAEKASQLRAAAAEIETGTRS